MKIVILDGYTLNPGDLGWDGFKELGEVTVYDRTPFDDVSEIISRIGDADVVITNKTPVNKKVLEFCTNIKYIGVLATGYNVVDVETCTKMGITVCNVPDYGSAIVGQFAIALLLEICSRVGHHSQAVRENLWEKNPDWCFWDYPLVELYDKTIGIIGFGRIGKSTGAIAKAMGMNIIAYDIFQDDYGKSIAQYVELDKLLKNSDIIALHCPLLEETKNIICKENINKMKDGVIILNNSRGDLIVEQDLADALNDGKVYAAGLDVVSSEPIKSDNPLLKAKNCIITPHISWAAYESRKRLMGIAVKNLRDFKNNTPQNVVNL